MKEKIGENENKIDEQNKYLCKICKSYDKYVLCDKCFKRYHSIYSTKKTNLENSEKLISQKICDLITYNDGKSKKLNDKISYDKYKRILLEKIKQEEDKIKELEEELKEYEALKIEQKDKNSRLNLKLIRENKEKDESSLFDSSVNLMNSVISFNENKNEDIKSIKSEIAQISNKIEESKKKYISNLFKELFIKNESIIKIDDFFNISTKKEDTKNNIVNNFNFSIINIKEKVTNEIKLDNVLKKNNIYLKRFNFFICSMVDFLEKAYKKFKLKMPYKIDSMKIENANGYDYKMELKNNELDNDITVNNAVKGYHLLNINYEYLFNYIFGDSKKLKYLFDMSFFYEYNNIDINLGSLKNIEEQSKIKENPIDNFGFEVLE